MSNIVAEASKYILVICILLYTIRCFTVFNYEDAEIKKKIYKKQTHMMFLAHFIGYVVLFAKTLDVQVAVLYVAEVVLLALITFLYPLIYPKVSRLIVNNMCMLLCIGMIMITRLKFEKAVRQLLIIGVAFVVSMLVPVIVRKMKVLKKWTYLYAVIGIAGLLAVAAIGQTSYGARLGFTIGGISIQPSEFIKIVFVFFVASSLNRSTEFRDVVKTTIIAALHVLILVASKDLGAALIMFVVYLVMLYVGTRNVLYLLSGAGAGALASIPAYYLFSHVRTRVLAWKDPIANYNDAGYQVAQSLFAIGSGGWFGMGLYMGSPDKIPVAEEDFIFSAICEEMGLVFAFCLILICLSCYLAFLNIAMQLRDQFYKLVALGLGTCYIFQVFLTIGGATKFIPSTGVTLPLVSYGGSSLLSTFIMFAIIQGLYILREDEEEDIERKKAERLRARRRAEGIQSGRRTEGSARRKETEKARKTRTKTSGKATTKTTAKAGKTGKEKKKGYE
jgi:cell division protein FtsW (lipid II flippase)